MVLGLRYRYLGSGAQLTLFLLALVPDALSACPDVDAELRSAEGDVMSFFLADAQKALGKAVEGLGCSAPATAEQVARYWQAQAMIWDLQGDARADSGFVASKRRGSDVFNDDYGAKVKARWEALTVPAEPLNLLDVRGLESGERIWVDGVEITDRVATPGLHLVQVGAETPRFAKAVEMPATGALTVAVPAAAAVVPEPVQPEPVAPEPVVEPEPVAPEPVVEPEPVAPEPVVEPEPAEPEPVEPEPEPAVGPKPPPVSRKFDAPLTGLGGRVADAEGRAMSWRQDVIPLARTQASGREALGKLPGNTLGQVGALAVTAGGAYAAYLFGWQLTTGRSEEPSTMASAFAISGIVAVTGLTTRTTLSRKRKKHKIAIRDAASKALSLESE